MGSTSPDEEEGPDERFRLQVDDRGRITVPKELRDRLGIDPNTDVVAYRSGSVLTVDPVPSERLGTATAGRDDWTDSTPTDAGRSLFGPMEPATSDSADERDSSGPGAVSGSDRGDGDGADPGSRRGNGGGDGGDAPGGGGGGDGGLDT